MTSISLDEQAHEAELHFLGLRDLATRAASGKIKRGPHEVERLQSRCAAAEAGFLTLRGQADRCRRKTGGGHA